MPKVSQTMCIAKLVQKTHFVRSNSKSIGEVCPIVGGVHFFAKDRANMSLFAAYADLRKRSLTLGSHCGHTWGYLFSRSFR